METRKVNTVENQHSRFRKKEGEDQKSAWVDIAEKNDKTVIAQTFSNRKSSIFSSKSILFFVGDLIKSIKYNYPKDGNHRERVLSER